MKRILAAILWFFSVASIAHAYTPQEGDIIFQTSLSKQSIAIQIATNSPYSHVGIVLFRKGQPYVFEAVQPVKYTPLKSWLARGKDGRYVAKRTKQQLTESSIAILHQQAQKFAGKPYDLTFEWSDTRMYCSELVWKLYKAAGIELAPLSKLGSFNLNDPVVKKILRQRYGDKVPLDEPVIAPSALFDSPLLITVAEGTAP
jgi:hypothetical protein